MEINECVGVFEKMIKATFVTKAHTEKAKW